MSNIVGLDLNIDQEYIAESVQKIVKAAEKSLWPC